MTGPGTRSATALVGFAFTVAMLGTTLPTPLYPALAKEFGFGELLTTVVFAAYPVAVTTALLVCGHWSDQVGRKPMLYAGLGFSGLSAVAFLLPPSLSWVFVARLLSGISAGIFTGTATATVVDLGSDEGGALAGLVAAAANMGGLGLGPLFAALVATWAPGPLTAPFYADLVLVGLALACIRALPETVRPVRRTSLRPQAVHVPAQIRPVFVRAAIAGFAGFAVLGLFSAVSPAFLGQVLGLSSMVVVGVVVASVFAASVLGQAASVRLSTARGLTVGCAALIAGMAMLAVSLPLSSLALLVAGGVVAGLGQGLSFRAGLGSVTEAAAPDQRGEVSSAYFVALYVGIAFPVVGEGVAATLLGLVPAGILFSFAVGLLALTVLLLLLRSGEAA
jgi:predicted MFS family arabinose efflux permease